MQKMWLPNRHAGKIVMGLAILVFSGCIKKVSRPVEDGCSWAMLDIVKQQKEEAEFLNYLAAVDNFDLSQKLAKKEKELLSCQKDRKRLSRKATQKSN